MFFGGSVMTRHGTVIRLSTLCTVVLLLLFSAPRVVRGQLEWRARVGAETHDKGRQALAFLPNELWIHAGDSITWLFDVDEIHTVTFLKAGQIRNPFGGPMGGCPGYASNPATFNGS